MQPTKRSWFEALTGFKEESPDQVRSNLTLRESTLVSRVTGRRMEAGRLEIPTLQQLRGRTTQHAAGNGRLTLEEVVADVQALHLSAEAEGALFQVASQFNLLEMISPSVTPEQGITSYIDDATQGPACAIAAGAGTLYRNYFAPVNGRIGQSADNQIDCLADLGEALGNTDFRLWRMQNGYALPSEEGLSEVDKRLQEASDAERDRLRGKIRVGLQWNTEVTLRDTGRLVTQAYCSALPVAYSPHASERWRNFACLVLEAAYEATLAAALLNWMQTGNNRVYLTLLGGGAFGNANDWILTAIGRALTQFGNQPLRVMIVSYRAPNPLLRPLLDTSF